MSYGDKGEIIEIRSNDIFTQALGTPEHPGRVRGKGKFVAQSEVFRRPGGGFRELQECQFHYERQRDKAWEKKLVS